MEEKIRRDRYQRELRTKLAEALQSGAGFFRGVQRDGSSLGQSLPEVLGRLLDWVIPDLYPKLEMGIRHLKGTEANEFLTAANLNALPTVFHDGEHGLNLVIKEGAKSVPHLVVEAIKDGVIKRVQELFAPEEKIERVRLPTGCQTLFLWKAGFFNLWQAAGKVAAKAGQPSFGQARGHRGVEDELLLFEISQGRVDGGQAVAQSLPGFRW